MQQDLIEKHNNKTWKQNVNFVIFLTSRGGGGGVAYELECADFQKLLPQE